VLALCAEVASKALAQPAGVVTDATAGAITSPLVAIAKEHVWARWAFFEGAIRATVAKVAHTANMLHGVPRGSVSLSGLAGKLLLCVADATAGAVIRADGTLARNAVVVLEALALAGLAVTDALVGALNLRVSFVGSGGHSNPRSTLGARAEGAVVLGPRWIAVGAGVANALVVARAGTVAGAPVRAVGQRDTSAQECDAKGEKANHGASCSVAEDRTKV